MNKTDDMRERLSALADGQLDGDEFASFAAQLCAEDEMRATWRTYHLVGDVLRSGQHVPCSDTSAFLRGFQQRLAVEEGIKAAAPQIEVQPMHRRVQAANEPVFRWKLVAGAASLAAAAAISWNWLGSVPAGGGAQLAQSSAGASTVAASVSTATTPVATRVLVGNNEQPQVMLRDPRLDALLEAHQQAGGGSQMPSGFLRNATFEGPSR